MSIDVLDIAFRRTPALLQAVQQQVIRPIAQQQRVQQQGRVVVGSTGTAQRLQQRASQYSQILRDPPYSLTASQIGVISLILAARDAGIF